MDGKLGKGVVKLTAQQTCMLLDRMGLDMFDHYVQKLADFIIKKNANPGNHYETILKWFAQDSGI